MRVESQKAYAKINLTLDILGKRPDGYHDIKTVMQPVSLCDDIKVCVNTHAPWKLTCSDPSIPADSRNLAWKAAEVFFDATGIDPEGLLIDIVKRIPSEAGMGGGSSDAAAVLRCLNRLYDQPYSLMQLADLGAKVGSDIPFCVVSATALAEGRGEILSLLPPLPKCMLVICKPDFSVSTPELYREVDAVEISTRPCHDQMFKALQEENVAAVAGLLCNVFDPLVASRHPQIHRIRSICLAHGALGCQMTGSGSAFYGIVPDKNTQQTLFKALKQEFPQTFCAESV